MIYNNDDYMNAAMAIGNTQDRSSHTTIQPAVLYDRTILESLYIGDGFARRVVDFPAEESTRAGFDIIGDIKSEKIAQITDKLKELGLSAALTEAVRWKRLFGGSAIIIGANDGGNLETPLNERNIREIEFLRVVDRYQMTWTTSDKYDDPADKRFGRVKLWTIEPINGAVSYKVHESRLLIFDGSPLPERLRESNNGWGMSVVQYCYDQARRLGMSYQHTNNLIERAQQAVHKIPKLAEYSRTTEGKEAVINRLDIVDKARSNTNTVAIDGEEDYEVHSLTFSQVPEVIDRFIEALCAVAEIPVTVFMGRSPGGLNATGKSDLDIWYGKIGKDQVKDQLKPIERIVSLVTMSKEIGGAEESWEIKFCPLSVPSRKEEAETDKTEAETAEKYVGIGALDPSEVRAHLKENSKYNVSDKDVTADPNGIGGTDYDDE